MTPKPRREDPAEPTRRRTDVSQISSGWAGDRCQPAGTGLRGRRNDLGEAISGIAIVDPCVTAWARQHPVIALVAAPLKNRVLRVAEAGCAQVGLWLSAAAIRLFHVHKGVRPERHQLIVLALCVPILKARKLSVSE